MLDNLKNVKGITLSQIAKLANIKPHRVLFALKDYSSRKKAALTESEEKKIVTAIRRLVKELTKIISHYD